MDEHRTLKWTYILPNAIHVHCIGQTKKNRNNWGVLHGYSAWPSLRRLMGPVCSCAGQTDTHTHTHRETPTQTPTTTKPSFSKAVITIAIRLRYDYDPTTTYRARLLPFDAIRREQKLTCQFFVVVVSYSYRSRIAIVNLWYRLKLRGEGSLWSNYDFAIGRIPFTNAA